MATITASAAGGASNTNGAWVGGVQPTAADDVIIDATSAGITIPSTTTLACRSLNASNGTLIFAATTSELDVGDANGGALTFNGSTTLTLTGVGLIKFVSTKASTTFSLTTGGRTLPSITVATGSTTTIACADALIMSTSGTFTSTTGKFDAASFSQTWGKSALGVGTKSVTFGTSSVTVTASSTSWDLGTNNSGLTLSAASSTITLSGASAQFNGGNNSIYGTVNFTGSGNAILSSGPWSCTNLTRTGTAVKTDAFQHGTNATITVTGVLTLVSNSATNRLLVQSNALGTQRTINCTGATVVIDNTAAASGSSVDFQDITITGSPTWTVNHSTLVGDAGGNGGAVTTNATAATPQTYTDSGSHSDNWSTLARWTSRVPLPQDNVTVPLGSTGTITTDMPRLGASVDFTGYTGTWTGAVSFAFYGNLTLASGMTNSVSATITPSGRGAQTVTCNGKSVTSGQFNVSAPGGSYTFQDAFTVTGQLGLILGTLSANNFNVTCATFSSSSTNTRTFTMGSGTWTLTSTATTTVWNLVTTGMTFTGSSSTVALSNASTNTRTFAGGGASYGTVQYTVANSPGQLVITGANTFSTLNIGSGRQVQMPASTTNNIGNSNPFSGAANGYLRLPGVSGSYASSPDSAALSITGDITIDCRTALDAWVGVVAGQILVAKSLAGQSSYQLFIDVNGKPILDLWATVAGANTRATSSAVVPFSAGATGWVRATWRASDGRVQFFTSTDDITYTQLGTNQTIAIASIADSTAILEVGSKVSGTNTLATGNFYQARVWSDITQTTKVFDADFTVHNAGSNNWTTSAKVQFQEASTNAANVNLNGLAQVGDGRVALTSSTGGTQATINYTGTGVVNSDYLTIQDSNATPSTITWYAGHNSTNVSNNTGWIFGATGFKASVSDTASASDAVSRSWAASRSASDIAGASDAVARAQAAARSASDTATASDSCARSTSGSRSSSDTASASDTIGVGLAFTRSASDTANATDTTTAAAAATRTLTDTASAGDTVDRAQVQDRAITDTAGAASSGSAQTAAGRDVTDTASSSDTADVKATLSRLFADTAPLTDTVDLRVAWQRRATDTTAAHDTAIVRAAVQRALSDTAPGSDVIGLLTVVRRAISDTVTGADAVVAVYVNAQIGRAGTLTSSTDADVVLTARRSDTAVLKGGPRRG